MHVEGVWIVASLTGGSRLDVGKLPAALLSRLIAAYGATGADVIVGPGIGRDAAALAIGDSVLVAKTDPITFATHDAPAYLVDVNANDISCLGATPKWLLVTTLLPVGTTEADVESLFAQLGVACSRRGIGLVGGHTEVTLSVDRPVLVGMMLGEATPDSLIRPGAARPGDLLVLAGAIAIEGTALLALERSEALTQLVGADVVGRAKSLIETPGISVSASISAFAGIAGVHAFHDPTEGGLATGVRELAEAAQCGAMLRRNDVPLLHETAAMAAALQLDPLGMLASGSLLIAVDPESRGSVEERAAAHGIEIAVIGALIEESEGFQLIESESTRELPEWTTDEVSRALAKLRS